VGLRRSLAGTGAGNALADVGSRRLVGGRSFLGLVGAGLDNGLVVGFAGFATRLGLGQTRFYRRRNVGHRGRVVVGFDSY